MSFETALLLIDVQVGFHDRYWGNRNNMNAEENISQLLTAFRKAKADIYHVQHLSLDRNSPLAAHQPGVELMSFVKPLHGEKVFQKNVNSAFIGTSLEETLHRNGVTNLVIAGFSTDHCVSTSARMSANLGFNTYVIADATATFERNGYEGTTYSADTVHAVALASLHQEFATVISTKEFLALNL